MYFLFQYNQLRKTEIHDRSMVCYKCCSKFLTIYVWDLKSRESFFLASLKTFREQARSQSKGLLFDSMILWERNPTEKKLPNILFLSSRCCCSFAFWQALQQDLGLGVNQIFLKFQLDQAITAAPCKSNRNVLALLQRSQSSLKRITQVAVV